MKFIYSFACIFMLFSSCNQDTKTPAKHPTKAAEITVPKTVTKQAPTPPKPITERRIDNKNVVPFMKAYGAENPETKVRIDTKFGSIEIELFEETPFHRASFIHLVKRNFFDETCFHRVDEGFVIQGGNSDRNMVKKLKSEIGVYKIPQEFRKHLKHHYGSVAMARSYKKNFQKSSNPYEFYIVMDKKGTPHLDNEHTVIGRVTKGMDVATKINQLKTDISEWPMVDVYMKASVIE